MAIDLGSWLRNRKKQLEGAVAQVNPFDNGKTYNTVVNNRPPVQPVQRAQPVRQVNQQQPGWSVRKQPSFDVVRPPKTTSQLVNESYGTGFTSLANRLKDSVNPNTVADQIKRRSQTGLNESYDQEQARKTIAAQNDPTKRNLGQQISGNALGGFSEIAKAPAQLLKLKGAFDNSTFGKAANTVTGTGISDFLIKKATGVDVNKKRADMYQKVGTGVETRLDNKIQQSGFGQRNTDPRLVAGVSRAGGQLLSQAVAGAASGGTTVPAALMGAQTASPEYDKARKAGKSNDYAIGVAGLQGAVSAATEKLGLDSLLRPGANIATKAARGFLSEGSQEGVQQLAQNLIANKTYDPNQGLRDGVAESALIGGLTGGAAGGLMGGFNNSPTPQKLPDLQMQKTARPNEYNVLSDYQDVLHGNIKNPTVINQTIQAARQAGQRLGLDVTSGSVSDINQRINEVLSQQPQIQQVADPVVTNMPVNQMTDPQSMRERIRAAKQRVITPLNEGGYIQTPGGQDTQLNDTELGVINYLNNKPIQEGSATQGEGNALPTELSTEKRQGYLDKMKKMVKPLNQVGAIGKDVRPDQDPLESLKQEARKFETLPEDIHPSLEAKAVGVKRIAPDRVPHQQLTVKEGIEKLVEADKNIAAKRAEGWLKVASDTDTLIKKYGDTIPARTKSNLEKYPDLQKDFATYDYLKRNTYGSVKTLSGMKEQFTSNSSRVGWNDAKEAATRASVDKKYRELVKKDISKGYRYPDEVLNYDKSFKTATDNRARYEKGLATSFSSDDSRIVFDDQKRIAGGMKRQDGKELTSDQKEEMVNGILQTQKHLGVDIDSLAKNNRWVFAHLNGKNPFLTKNAAGLYRGGKDHASVSVGGTETFNTVIDGKKVTKRVNTTMAHELGHALDLQGDKRLLDRDSLWQLRNKYNSVEGGFRGSKYWNSEAEMTARAIAQYVQVAEGSPSAYSKPGNWNKELFDQYIKPSVEKGLKEKYPDYQISKATQPPKSTAKTVEDKPPTPFEQNLQTAGLAPKKAKGLVVSETKPLNGQKIQKVRTGKGQVEQRLVQDRSSEIADALGIPQDQRTPTNSFEKQSAQTQRVADNINSQNDNIAYNEQPRDIKQKKSKEQFKETFNRWLGTKQAAKTRSVATARTLRKLNNSDALEAIQAIDNSSYVPKSEKAKQFVEQFRTKTDVLYQRYTGEKGVNMGYVDDYLPRIYKNPEGGAPLTKAEYQALQMSTGRMKGRESDLLDVDALITKDPRELLAKYVDSMENVVNNRSFVNALKKNGHLIEAPSRPQGAVIIDAPGFPQPRLFTNPDTGEKIQGNYYATPDVAKVLNRSFEPDIRTSTTGKILKKTAAVAGKVQDLGLSGGVPGTPINAFGFAQILRNTMGGNIRGTAKGTTLSFSKRLTDRYFDKHAEDLAELQEQGINVRTSYTEKGLQSFMKRVATAESQNGKSTVPAKTKKLFDESWDAAMNDPTFSRLLPVMQLDYYRHVRDNLKRVGVAPDKAAKIASKRLKEFEGLTDQATLSGRNKVANDALTTFLFAPKYRESMIKFWGNNIKALAPQNVVKALNPKSGEYRSNLIFNAAAAFLFMMMDKENQEQNEGRHLWDNPPGKKDKLLIKIGNGQTIGIPFLSSIATMPRTALNLGNDVISGNTEQLGKDAKSFLGYGIRPLADIVTNEDYFGNKIRKDGASLGENLKRSGMFALKQYNHPYIRAGISKVQSGNTKDPNDPNKKTDLQIVSEAAESPVRFYKDKSVKYGLMYEQFDKDLKGVSNQTKQQFERWHPGRNDMGELEPFDNNNFYSKERADALQDNDLYALEKKYAELQNKYHGKPLDPIFTLGEQERRLVLNKKALKPGQTDPELSKLYDKEWYQDYQNKSSQYYAAKNEWNTAQGFESTFKNDNPYPEVPKELQNAMDFYSSLPKGTGARSGFIRNNPDVWNAMTNQWAMKDNWENKERAKYGLAATEGDAGVANGFKEPTTKYASSGSKGGRKGTKKGKGSRGGKLGAIDFGTTDLVATNKRLQSLLGGTTVKPVKNKKVTVKKPKLKKVA